MDERVDMGVRRAVDTYSITPLPPDASLSMALVVD